jgi:hypothetical protein
MVKGALNMPDTTYNEMSASPLSRRTTSKTILTRRLIYLCTCALLLQAAVSLSGMLSANSSRQPNSANNAEITARRSALIAKCTNIHQPAGPPASFTPASRLHNGDGGNERWVAGTPSLLDRAHQLAANNKAQIVDAHGRWLTPGLVDIHSHLGVNSAPSLSGAFDGNSHNAPILPWLRSVDGLNTHDEAYKLSIAGGVTTAQVLPGSANNIGGQAFVIKLRETAERSTTSRVLEPPETLVGGGNATEWVHWRHMKYAANLCFIDLTLTLIISSSPHHAGTHVVRSSQIVKRTIHPTHLQSLSYHRREPR